MCIMVYNYEDTDQNQYRPHWEDVIWATTKRRKTINLSGYLQVHKAEVCLPCLWNLWDVGKPEMRYSRKRYWGKERMVQSANVCGNLWATVMNLLILWLKYGASIRFWHVWQSHSNHWVKCRFVRVELGKLIRRPLQKYKQEMTESRTGMLVMEVVSRGHFLHICKVNATELPDGLEKKRDMWKRKKNSQKEACLGQTNWKGRVAISWMHRRLQRSRCGREWWGRATLLF